ncbi:hypothetical protein EOD39_6951 [Acipenser ruthenus]|uniref:DDE Tnp4 domain-containing protein n=1 Tax=Acipenser ruthenus TaxID=7906 RepID=A0A662YZQ1_ACIRT|nr:hypothetical protein EOD39_6951 [Acipenser ruthenus]
MCFMLVDIGSSGRWSDGGILAESRFRKALEQNRLSVPSPRALPGSSTKTLLVVVGDEAFPLKPYLMRPYPGKHLPVRQNIYIL